MHSLVRNHQAEIAQLCRDLGVRRLDLFGSAVGEGFDVDTSDIDVLVEFETRPDFDYFGAYFGLKEGLEGILGRPVDLVTLTSVRNPYFRRELMATKETLYAA